MTTKQGLVRFLGAGMAALLVVCAVIVVGIAIAIWQWLSH